MSLWLRQGEVAGVLVSAPVQVSAMAGVFGDTAASVLSAVAGTGTDGSRLRSHPRTSRKSGAVEAFRKAHFG
jgi:hypothetical protein